MRNTKVWRLIISLLLLSPFVGGLTWAQLSNGEVYNFVNVANSGSSMTSTAGTNVSIAATSTSDYKQLWYVEEVSSGVYTLRNLGNGKYLRSSNATSELWSMVVSIDDNCKFTCSAAGSGYTLRATNDNNSYGYMHYGANQGSVVCWELGAEATRWTVSEVSVSASDLAANWAELDALANTSANVGNYQTALNALFKDQSCSALNATYAAYTTAQMQADNNYKALPAALQAMVLKMTTDGTWEEANYDTGKSAWGSDYAKKYRVQLYEPYNEVGAASTALGLNAHTNINNPTGIFVNNRGIVYVMVEGEIKDGASLYLTYYTGHGKLGNSYSDGVELHEGLNIIPYYADNCNLCVNYVVHTFDTSGGKKGNNAKARKLSDYADLKIHIEGGYINGYYNKMGDELYGSGDKNADWDYIEARATQTDVTVLGKYITLQFPLNDANTEGNKGLGSYFNELVNIEPVINEWDKVMLWERLVLGVLDKETIEGNAQKSPYSDKDHVFAYTGDDTDGFGTDYGDYYNVHGLAFGVGGSSYMYGGWDHCGYHYNTMGSVIQNLPTNAGSHWGPGHEIGHQHQELLNMRGLTEVTNNLFANVVLWYFGETTSRYNGNQGSLTNVLEQYNAEGTDFFSNNIWAQTIMYYKLFLYYHVLGHNPKFYPRLFEMLRQDPMNIAYEQDGSKCLMHFYKKCCLASGDDLTEFFRAHGFFEVMENRLVGDYSSAVYNLTQDQIDAAIEDVKSWGYPENLAVLFVNDATGETIQSYKGDNLDLYGETTICAEVGSYASYTSTNVASSYTYTVSGNTITMEGTGGVGFAILNADGEIIGFSDKKTFEISNECAALIASGEAKVVVTNYDNSEPVVATDIMNSGSNDEQYEVLGELLESAKVIVDLSDDTGTKVGWYRKESIATLTTAYTAAKTAYDNKTVGSYRAVYNNLLQAYIDVQGDEYAKIGIVEGTAYRLVNKAYPGRSMAVDVNDDDKDTYVDEMFGLTTDESSDAQLWYFEAGSTSGTYYLKNKSTSKYPGNVSSGSVLSADKTATSGDAAAYAYTFHDLGDGTWAFSGNTGLHCASSQSYNIVGWGWGSDTPASHWYITAVEENEVANNRAQLEELIAKTKDLVDEMSVVTYRGDLDMSQYRISSNATESGHETNYLVDNNNDTYFHTVWRDSEVAENHYFQIDLGDGESLSEFVLKYTTYTTGWTADLPTTIVVTASTDGELWNDITTLTNLPTTQGTDYTSAVLGDGSTSYRYWRFTVTGTSSGGSFNGYKYFGLAEVKLNIPETQVHKIQTKYTSYLETSVLTTACDEIVDAVSVYDNTEATAETYKTAYNDLYAEYEKLLDAYTNAKSASLAAKKQELQTLITNTNTLMAECGTVNYTPGTYDGTPKLQSTDNSENFYIWTNAQSAVEGPIKDLVDGDNSTFFHSDYSGNDSNDGLDHHITVNLGVATASSFTFNYVTRHNAQADYPATIAVYGSVDGTNYGDPLATFTGLPTGNTQSYTSTVITSDAKLKYLRFMVTATNNNNKKNGHPIFHMAEFGLTINGTSDNYAVELGANAGEVTEELMISAYRETASATATLDNATTEMQLIQAIAALQAEYDELYEKKNASVAVDKSALEALIAQTNELLDRCGDIDIVQTPVVGEASALTTTENSDFYVSTNADQNTGGGNNDGGGIAALVDNSEDTYFHTRWSGTVVDEAHHVQIDLGDANLLSDFKFSYTPRNGSPAPTAMTVYGSNDANSFTDVLATITSGLPAHNSGSTYTSDVITSATKYRYLRFVVTASAGPGNAEYGGQYFFGMREFDLYPITSYNSENVASVDPNAGSVTEEQILDAYNSKEEAVALTNSDCTQEEVTAKTAELQAYYDALLAAYNTKLYPVTLTTDAANPVLYIMKSRRGDAKVVQYLPLEGHKFNISDTNDGSAVQAFYFMEGTERGQVYVHPYAAGGMVLAANNTGDGADKAFAVKMGGATYEQWKFVEATVEEATWYSLQPIGTSTYFSHYGGGNNKMGFYSAADDGSYLQFVSTTVEGSAAYNSLKTYYDGLTLSNITGGTAVGFYPEAQATTYNSAYAVATALLNPGTIVETKRILTADELRAGVAKRTIGLKCVQEDSYEKWVSEAGGLSETLAANTIFSLEPTTDGQSGSYYLKAMSEGDDGYFQQSGYALGAKESAQAFVPVEAIYQGGSGNTAFAGSNADLSGASDLENLVRFVLGSEDGTTYLNPGFTAYNGGTGVWTVYNVYEVCYYAETSIEDADYTAAYNALKAANEALDLILPEEGKHYVIESVLHEGQVMYATGENKVSYGGGRTDKAETIWYVTDVNEENNTFHLANLQTGCTLSNALTWGGEYQLGSEAKNVEMQSADANNGIVLLVPAGGQPMHASGGVVMGWGAYGADSNSAWTLKEISDMSAVKFELTIGQYEHAGMYLNYPVTIPEGVVVKYPNDIEVTKAEGGKVMFAQVEDELPARTGVIVEGSQGTYTFYYDTTPAAEITDNLLSGSAYTTYLPGAAGYSYYLFGVKNNLVGFYMAYLEYNEDGTQTVYDENGNAVEGESLNDTDNGTHFRVGANKVYLPYDYSISGAVTMFGFGDTVTDIDGVETDLEHAAIYDLSGRRIERITTSGIYIVNGRKQYVRASQIK